MKSARLRLSTALVAASLALGASPALAQIKIGAILSLTGPAASLGIPEKQTIDILPRKIGDQDVTYVILDDASDPSAAVRAARKLMDEEKVDVILGPSITPTSLAVVEAIGPGETAMISAAGSAVIARPVEGNKRWSFVLAPAETSMAHYVYGKMTQDGQKTVAFIGYNDAFGDSFIGNFKRVAEEKGFQVLADERFNARDTSVTAQALSVFGHSPDAVIIGASGTPGVGPVLELRNLGYEGSIFLNQGMANPDVLRVGKEGLEGVMLGVSPALVAEQLPEDHPSRAEGVRYVTAYEGAYGPGTRSLFGATVWDAFLIVENAVPAALNAAQPGTVEFRRALRDAMENTTNLIGAQGVFNMTPTDHNGTDLRAQVLVGVKDGGWSYIPLD